MEQRSILLAVCGQVLVTFLVWVLMFYTRLGAIKRSRTRIQKLADGAHFEEVTKDVIHPSDNFENLFEMPVLFYAAMLLIVAINASDRTYSVMAWMFVILRAAHSYIHCTSNVIRHRFMTYLLSSLVVWVIWGRILAHLL